MRLWLILGLALASCLLGWNGGVAAHGERLIELAAKSPKPAKEPAAPPANPPVPMPPAPAPVVELPPQPVGVQPEMPENVEADVSTHTVAITSTFSGTEMVVFGAVANSRQPSAESGYYDVVVLIDGASVPTVVRLKDNIAGLWVNTQPVRFDNLPVYSAIASTRPIEEISEPAVRVASGIGYARARMLPVKGASRMTVEQIDAYKTAVLRLKQKDGLYVRSDYGVAFIGPSLFRASVKLPANIPVGPLEVRVILFQDGRLLSVRAATVMLEREGLERLIYDFAHEHPVYYGALAVLLAVAVGLFASTVLQRSAR
jgi:uncharacterized protein (TIGR02186 family)